MAATANGRVLAIVGVVIFMAGCLTGMRSDTSGEQYCVVTPGTAAAHPGFEPGQFVEQPEDGCLDGEHEVCGRFEGSGDSRRFESDKCPD
jgi:hypothetical protein